MIQALAVLIGAAAAIATVRWSRRPGTSQPRWLVFVFLATSEEAAA